MLFLIVWNFKGLAQTVFLKTKPRVGENIVINVKEKHPVSFSSVSSIRTGRCRRTSHEMRVHVKYYQVLFLVFITISHNKFQALRIKETDRRTKVQRNRRPQSRLVRRTVDWRNRRRVVERTKRNIKKNKQTDGQRDGRRNRWTNKEIDEQNNRPIVKRGPTKKGI